MSPSKSGRRVGAPGKSVASRLLILAEDLGSKFQAVHEGMAGLEHRLVARMDSLEQRLVQRIEVLEAAVRQNSADIRQNSADIAKNSADIAKNSADIRKNSEDIEALKVELRELRGEVRQQASAADLARLQRRVEALEQRAGIAAPVS
ncbi:MAG: hypothetical protein ACKVPX_01225 [Myxococcaceae bacterium]